MRIDFLVSLSVAIHRINSSDEMDLQIVYKHIQSSN